MTATTHGRWTFERITDPAIRAMEVWDRDFGAQPVGAAGSLLYQVVGSQRLDALRARCPTAREAGTTLGSDVTKALRMLIDQAGEGSTAPAGAWLGGGLLNSDGLRETILEADLRFPLVIADDPTFCAAPGGRELLASHGDGRGVVLDVGQTSIKGVAHTKGRARQLVFPRDHHSLPLHLQERPGAVESAPTHVYIERAAGFIARAVQGFLAIREPPPPLIVLALPAALSDDGTPAGCTYPGWAGSTELLPRIAAQLDEWIQADPGHPWRSADGRILLLNDTELAARSARLQSSALASKRTLVVTLGFGPGAAILEPAAG